jgi:hypothetical protein
MISSSLASGSAFDSNYRFGINGVVRANSFIKISQNSDGSYQFNFQYGAMTASISTTDGTLIFDALAGTTVGSFFSNIRDSNYSYRYALSEANSPAGSYPLNGYYFTHYRHKRPLVNRSVVVTLDVNNNVNGTFQAGVQNSGSTVYSGSGLLDGSLPVSASFVTGAADWV